MNTNLTPYLPQRSRNHPLVAGAAGVVILASSTGIAAMTGILPTSRATTEPSTQAIPVAAQIASAPVASPQPKAEQHTTQEDAPIQAHVRHHRSAPVEQAPKYANNDTACRCSGKA
ncbi:hypothetical protein [Paraburkholderia strydomiana]|uniref:hypothetical protein n=1 Tax=Paraburkholderia strydomiana TaxID=1245417 RepID=UPI0038B9F4DB